MSFKLWINKINFKNEVSIPLKNDSIVVFVGSNNSGKSLVLREISEKIRGVIPQPHKIINDISISKSGSIEDLFFTIKNRKIGNTYIYPGSEDLNAGMDESGIKIHFGNFINDNSHSAAGIADFFVKSIDTLKRLYLVSPIQNIDAFEELKTHPIHELKYNPEKEKIFSQHFNRAFGKNVIVNHNYGSKVSLHVGTPPNITVEKHPASLEYQTELRQLPFLHDQGDGMKSFAGVFLSLYAEDFTINLIDEPEAFLHPPQATILGQMISKIAEDKKQMFIATHSEHFLKGLLDQSSDRLIIIRMQRDEDLNSIHILDNEGILKVWNDTLLRHSNVLDGLFHKKVVLVESDSDCKFYNCILSALVEDEKIASPDMLFISAGGKDRFPIVIGALKALEVPMIIVGDFDLYQNENPVKKMYEELGGKWDDIKKDFYQVKKSIDQKIPDLITDDLKENILNILNSVNENIFPQSKIKELQTTLKKASPWKQAKSSGKNYLPAGQDILAFNRVQLALYDKNIIILDNGEIETFDKTIGGHGPKWVNEVLKKDIILAPELRDAVNFVKKYFLGLNESK